MKTATLIFTMLFILGLTSCNGSDSKGPVAEETEGSLEIEGSQN